MSPGGPIVVMSSPSQPVMSFNILVIDELDAEARALFTSTTNDALGDDTDLGKENAPPCTPLLKSSSCRRRLRRSSSCVICGGDVDTTGEVGRVVSQCAFCGHVLWWTMLQ